MGRELSFAVTLLPYRLPWLIDKRRYLPTTPLTKEPEMPPSGIPSAAECIEEATEQRTSSPATSQACSVLAIAIGLQDVVDSLGRIEDRLLGIYSELDVLNHK
jgi:hypothetical protein